jgi:large subunit ribosomal protein L24
MSKWIQKGDKVIITAGDDKGRTGEVLIRINKRRKSDCLKGDRVIVQGVNLCKRHLKKTRQGPGSIVEKEAPINISNVSICSAEGRPVRLHARFVDGVKELYYNDGPKEVVHRQVKTHKRGKDV